MKALAEGRRRSQVRMTFMVSMTTSHRIAGHGHPCTRLSSLQRLLLNNINQPKLVHLEPNVVSAVGQLSRRRISFKIKRTIKSRVKRVEASI